MSTLRWLASHDDDDGEVVFRIGRDGDELVAEWVGLARLTARRDGSAAHLSVVAGADPRDVRKIERGSMRLLLRHAEGRLAFHGSAIEMGGRVRVLLGRSGEGKSTLAAWLCAHAGATLFADDAVAIEPAESLGAIAGACDSFVVEAVEREHWLDDASRRAVAHGTPRDPYDGPRPLGRRREESGKRPLSALRPGAGNAPLETFVELVYSDVERPRVTAIHGVEALAALIPQAVRFVLDEPSLHRRELDRLSELVERVGVFRLERPRDLAHLASAAALVQDSCCRTEPAKGRSP